MFLTATSYTTVYSVTIYIGGKDRFGYGDAVGYFDNKSTAPDKNGNEILDSGNALPDLNRDGHIATNKGDDFDFQSTSEIDDGTNSTGTYYTDVALSDILDAEVTIKIHAPREPYVAFDYALLDTAPISTIPEPMSLILLESCLFGIGLRRWKK